ncbi:DDE-type integrase/transposase/recombinase [Plantactinospora sp. KLBMP9567]|uniref:DDE-type integrase/transposase/recombinase n=1 Tax=Plantactinospora sp. KLBMP9567 TaxID=3085900 RepID=UPI002981EF57|nr:DDE-type integrase/transposase/recombinase [Plantactinospora sp. KLBMP9567]MDW5327328.1 DDE-type integrase/transposase/recombinase [Plantactinospora sp. KLBMP9567]MDW5327716.1 DDE-type integrase/transposase/recombinase [Plantactinospora sp. KLBMP9567]MDW5328615.1 DDE-type integrase/transposase/recombinase [Plantactinospora sp. KLBMP9567]MDW5330329.1 DDE-type integrase/transposase/recombinase [Plantactinospora sp. KLBMP9567]MDW5330464.1 DDE-type integrase/transposase/recombinase [Plantactino
MANRRQVMTAMDALLAAGVRIDNVQQWCDDNNVNPRTFYRHRARVQAEGVWRERSRRPHHSPGITPPELDAWICKLRNDLGVDNGADQIRDELLLIHAFTDPGWRVPSRSTINRVLSRHDLLDRNPAKRPRGTWRRFAYAQPRDCYQIDATRIRLANGQLVAVFDVLDDCTRMLVACRAAPAETSTAAIAAIGRAFTDHGPPAIVLSDNGTIFTHRLLKDNAGPSPFAETVHHHGTRLIHSSPYHPQTCGKVERHHQTLKRWLTAQPHQPHTLRQLQRLLDTYRHHYNHHRRHSALPGRVTPHHAWTTAPHHGGPQALPIQTDATVHHPTVSDTGAINVGYTRIGLGCIWRGHTVTAIRDGNHITVYASNGHPIGHTTAPRDKKTYTRLTPISNIIN